ncbi:MAG TPA: alpha/beta fold hydrolase [Gammaproteobacteria bacterium]
MSLALAHETLGSGEPLLILHGLFGSKRNWMSLVRPLSAFARVIAVDLRNHGDSPHVPAMGYHDMALDVLALCDQLGLERVNIAGHSMGGKVAMIFALDHPERTRRLMVLDVAPVRYDSGFDRYVAAMQSLPLESIRSRREAEASLAAAVPDPATRQFLLHNLVRDGESFRWRINLGAIAANLAGLGDFPATEHTWNGPARFVAGGRADYLRPEHAPAIRRLFPAATMHTIEDAGHWLHADRPEAVIAQFREFLAGG